jgi:hypothetical protein
MADLYDYDVAVSWLRLQTPIDCIPHLHWIYTKCFSTLRCCGWAYHGCTHMPYHYMCRWGWISGQKGYGRACMILWCRGRGWKLKTPMTSSHIHIGCIQSVLAPWDEVDGPMGASLCCNTIAAGGEIREKRGMVEPVWYCGVMVKAEIPHWLHPKSILDVYKVFELTLRCCRWAYGCILML